MADFKEFIEGFAEEKKKPNRPEHNFSVYSDKHPHIPMTKTTYEKQGSKWKPTATENEVISREKARLILDKKGLPFEKSHRLEKRDRFGHNEPYDTFSSISPDGMKKSTWSVDFAKGLENYRKLQDKSYYDRMRYKKKKEANKGE